MVAFVSACSAEEMGFNPPVPEQYSDWEIRAAVLFSLMLQVVLIFVAPVRKRSSSMAPQLIVWSCYLLADWVADLALGLLLNSLGNIGRSSSATSSPIIFAFWAPFLLLHLGGPDSITAYSLADNELWLRHLVGLLFELTAAAVVFFCSLTQGQGSNNPMMPATVLMFVVGIIKYGERTYSLYFARVEPNPGPEYANRKIDIFGGHQGTRRRHGGAEDLENLSVEAQGYEFFRVFRFLYVNLILSFVSERRMSHDFFMARSDSGESFAVVEAELSFLYDIKYTKAPVIHTVRGYVLRSVCSCCLVASLVLFVHADKQDGSILPVDVGITYALLGGAVALDVAALAILLLSDWTTVFLERSRRLKWLAGFVKRIKRWWWRRPRRRWSETTSQMNIISRSLGRPDTRGGRFLWHAAELLGLGATFEDFFFVRQAPLGKAEGEQRHIFEFIFGRLKEVASTAQNYEEIKKACQLRGMGAIEQKLGEQGSMTIRDSVTKDLDESLLLWHVATDLCLAGAEEGGGDEKFAEMREISKCLSDYMLYLLIKQSDMLSAVAGIGLIRYRDTCAEARKLFSSLGLMTRSSADRLHDMARSTLLIQAAAAMTDRLAKAKAGEENSDASRSVLLDACALATELKKLEEKTMWEVVMGVWGEMLTFVACRGRGISHVQQLSRGGELITMVSFLMNHLGLGMMY